MRIVSLVPHATELLFALGLGDEVVGVTHECDHPQEAQERAQVTRNVLEPGLSPRAIDAAVRERVERGESIYELDEELVHELEPDLIVTQALCHVCAVSVDEVRALAQSLPDPPRVISLDPTTYGETVGDVRTVAQATGAKDAALELIARTARRVDLVRLAIRGAPRPRVAALEWLDPVFVGGHWVPQMIELAGGEDVLGLPGEKSRVAEWAEVEAVRPEVVVSMPCGYYAEQAAKEPMGHADRLVALRPELVVAVDAAAYFSRPGPRLVDGVELLAHLFHPDRVEPPPERRSIELDLHSRAA